MMRTIKRRITATAIGLRLQLDDFNCIAEYSFLHFSSEYGQLVDSLSTCEVVSLTECIGSTVVFA